MALCKTRMHRCADVKSVALTKISVDQMVERDAWSGVGRGRAVPAYKLENQGEYQIVGQV